MSTAIITTDLQREEILGAIHSLRAASMPVTVNSITTQLTEFIVNNHDGAMSLFVYKQHWTNSIISVLNSLDITYNKTRPSWEKIGFMIFDKKVGIVNDFTADQSASNRVTVSTASPEASSFYSSTTASTISKQPKLSPNDKLLIKSRFEQLDEGQMWRLSSGTLVEKQMEKFALLCNFEHPVHSFVLDTTDVTWKKYFTAEELKEIKFYSIKKLIDLPEALSLYINQLRSITDLPSLKQSLSIEQDDSDCEWVRNCLLNYMNLFKCGYLPPTDQSEGDMLRRVWFFVDNVFDTSVISCRGGEKSSKSSSSSRNSERALAGESTMERKAIGRKLDMVYFRQASEYGSCECGRYEEQTKELNDGGFKMAKVSKDMITDLCRKSPNSIRDLSVVGFLLFGTKFTLMLYDLPAGYVCRGNSLPSLYLPEDVEDLNFRLLDMLTITYKARLVMERNNRTIRQSRVPLDFDDSINNYNEVVLPCFQSEDNKQKRKRSNTATTITTTTATTSNDE